MWLKQSGDRPYVCVCRSSCEHVSVCMHVSVCEVLTIKCSTTSHHLVQSVNTAVLIQGLETLFRGVQAETVNVFPLEAKTGLAKGPGPANAS